MNVRLKDGQVLNCEYGHHWPLSLFTTGYVRISMKQTRKGLRLRYKWAATRAELSA